MDSNSVVIKYLNQLGYSPKTDYYSQIEMWKEWYENYVSKFHKYHDQNGEERQLYKLGMAKRLCEDWSSLLYTERDSIVCENENNQRYIDKWLKQLRFNEILPENIEKAFWSGTVGTITRINNAKIVNKKIVATKDTTYDLINITADQIIPLKIIDGKIQDVAFVSRSTIEQEDVYYIEIHELQKNGYIIKNRYINDQGEEVTNKDVVPEYYTGSNIPIFNLLSPRIVNNIKTQNGLGISVYANAIDQLKSADTVYNNFVMDFYLGGKKVFYNKKLTKYNTKTYTDKSTGETVIEEIPIYPDDITKQQFQVVGDDASINDQTLIQEHNPDLRVADNEKGLELALNMLSFKCGLGKGYYKFENGRIVTATEAIISDRDLVGNAKKHRSAVNEYTVGIVKSILLLGRILFNEDLDENDTINLVDKDGFLQDEETQKEQYLNEISAGIRSKVSYLMKFYGLSEEEAKKELALVNEEDSLSVMDIGEEGGV